MGELYHAGHKRNLKKLLPSISSHGRQWLYASKDLIISILFLAPTGGDLTCQVGRSNKIPYLCERFKGAFKLRYQARSGSIYVIDDEGFVEEQTEWLDELVCPHPKVVLREIPVEDVEEYLYTFEKEGRLKIYYYPDRPDEIPYDDSDLVDKCVGFIGTFGEDFWHTINQYQSQLVDRIKEKINMGL